MTGAQAAEVARVVAEASALQARAARPEASIWVAASAGTGKTKVLIDRVLSLMLAGTAPEKILCLTFTKAAAAEMAKRIAARLGRWVTAPEPELAEALTDLLGRTPDAEDSLLARRLFARVLDAEGGLKIQTIHAFCQSLLGRFPLEAGVAPHFRLLEERGAAELLAAAREEVFGGSLSPDEPAGGRTLDLLAAFQDDAQFAVLLDELKRERGRFGQLVDTLGQAGLTAAVNTALGVSRDETPDLLLAAALQDSALDLPGLRRAAAALASGSARDQDRGALLAGWLALPAERRPGAFEDYAKVFLTADGQVRKTLLTKAALASDEGALAVMEAEAERLLALRERCNKATVAQATAALVSVGADVLAGYRGHKASQALLDYDDLILRSRDMLAAQGMAGWVLYKLDGGLDHVLIDEAQDTNPEQWQVVEALTREFFAGAGAHEGLRSVFAVGDVKQSIFSFQRARPEAFLFQRGQVEARAEAAGRGWDSVELDISFRSGTAVLQAVDAVFARPAARDGVLSGEEVLRHRVKRLGQASRVEVWPPAPVGAPEEEEAWSLPIERRGGTPPRLRLAQLIARRIHYWTLDPEGAEDPESFLASKDRRLRPEDFLILVRRRNEFVEEVVRELKLKGVPVAGVDRMVLTDQLAVMDLVALGRFLLMPEDDLTLATVLKGPFVGLDEAQLFDLAFGREGTLWAALWARRGESEAFAEAVEVLSGLLARVDLLPPFELYAEILGPDRGREKLLARLGREAADPIEEFLSLAQAYERDDVPSLEGFLHWLESGRQEIKRDLEHGGRAVRVMTVHGAKGLEAPVVFLPDTLQLPTQRDRLLWMDEPDLLLWSPRKDCDDELAASLKSQKLRAELQEYRRLLYVAMTRAEDRLYVCGWEGRNKARADCWYGLIGDGLASVAPAAEFDFSRDLQEDGWAGPGLVLETGQTAPPEETSAAALERAHVGLPDWARLAAPPERLPPRPLAPSRPALAEPPSRSPLAEGDAPGLRRGRLVHRLLELLPDLPEAERAAAGERLVALPLHGLAAEEGQELLADTLELLAHPDFQAFLGPDSRAEVPVAGVVPGRQGPQVVSGQIDRLAVFPEQVAIVDYKTNRQPPAAPDDVPEAYLRQMAAYHALLSRIFPERAVACFLLWTEGPRLMQLSPAQLADHAP